MAVDGKIKVTLLGTGTPVPNANAFGSATLIEAAGMKLLLDCGRGVVTRLAQADVPIGQIDAVFISHYHSDHYSGLPDLTMTGAIPLPFGMRSGPLAVYGPPGLQHVTDGIWELSTPDRDIRVADAEIDAESMRLVPHVYEAEGVIFEKNGLTLTAILVDHGDFIKPAYAFRVDYNGHSFVHSCDTRFNENLIAHAKNVDVFVHEVAAASAQTMAANPAVRVAIDHHITPERVAEVFERASPKLAMLTHLVLMRPDPPQIEDVIDQIAERYHGPLVVAEDMMTIHIGNAVSIVPFSHGSK